MSKTNYKRISESVEKLQNIQSYYDNNKIHKKLTAEQTNSKIQNIINIVDKQNHKSQPNHMQQLIEHCKKYEIPYSILRIPGQDIKDGHYMTILTKKLCALSNEYNGSAYGSVLFVLRDTAEKKGFDSIQVAEFKQKIKKSKQKLIPSRLSSTEEQVIETKIQTIKLKREDQYVLKVTIKPFFKDKNYNTSVFLVKEIIDVKDDKQIILHSCAYFLNKNRIGKQDDVCTLRYQSDLYRLIHCKQNLMRKNIGRNWNTISSPQQARAYNSLTSQSQSKLQSQLYPFSHPKMICYPQLQKYKKLNNENQFYIQPDRRTEIKYLSTNQTNETPDRTIFTICRNNDGIAIQTLKLKLEQNGTDFQLTQAYFPSLGYHKYRIYFLQHKKGGKSPSELLEKISKKIPVYSYKSLMEIQKISHDQFRKIQQAFELQFKTKNSFKFARIQTKESEQLFNYYVRFTDPIMGLFMTYYTNLHNFHDKTRYVGLTKLERQLREQMQVLEKIKKALGLK